MAYFDDYTLSGSPYTDMSFLTNYNRMQNLVQPPPMGGMTDPYQVISKPDLTHLPSPPAGTAPFDPMKRMQELYQPDMMMQNRYNQMLGNYPQMQQPSVARRLAASILGGVARDNGAATFDAAHPGYRQAVADWQRQAIQAEKAADNERAENINRRQFAQQQVAGEQRQQQLDEAERRNKAREEETAKKDREMAANREKRTNIYETMANQPNMHPFVNKGGNVFMYNSKTGEMTDTGLDSNTLSDSDKMRMQLSNSLAEIKARTAGAVEVKGTPSAASLEEKWSAPIQLFDENNKPSKVIQVNQRTGEQREVKTQGSIKPTPRGAAGGGTTETDTSTTRPPTLLERVMHGNQPVVTKESHTVKKTTPAAPGGTKRTVVITAPNGQTKEFQEGDPLIDHYMQFPGAKKSYK